MKVFCPKCASFNTVQIVNFERNTSDVCLSADLRVSQKLKSGKAILANQNYHYTMDYDGKIIKRNIYDRYCKNCKTSFYYYSNLVVGDIIKFTIIMEINKDRWKYTIKFDKKYSTYSIEHNYFDIETNSILTPARENKILIGIDKSNLLKWKPMIEKNFFDYKMHWNIYVTFYNNDTFTRGGYDEYPKEWEILMQQLKKVFKNNIFKT